MALLLEFPHEPTGCALAFVDDGRVGYAYLRDPEGAIIADVWLYNRLPAPADADWSDPRQAPFLNPEPCALPLTQPPPRAREDVRVVWSQDDVVLLADVYLREQLLGRLSPGSQPGWATLARTDGPLARRFEAEEPPAPDDGERGTSGC